MGTLLFKAADVRRVVDHALGASDWADVTVGFTDDHQPIVEAGRPAVLLVHDDGVYLMSNGMPRDRPDPNSTTCFVAHARGCNPRIDPDSYETSRRLVGGDDFGETLPWAQAIREQLDAGAQEIRIWFGADNVELLNP